MKLGYFKLLDIVTITRSGKHIEKYYGTSDMGDGGVSAKITSSRNLSMKKVVGEVYDGFVCH